MLLNRLRQLSILLSQLLELFDPLREREAMQRWQPHRTVKPVLGFAAHKVEIAIAFNERALQPRSASCALIVLSERRTLPLSIQA